MRAMCLAEQIHEVMAAAMQQFLNSAILQEVALECLAALSAAGGSHRLKREVRRKTAS